jgi:hypothetical protein
VLDTNIRAVVADGRRGGVLPESPTRAVFAQGLAKTTFPAARSSLTRWSAVAIIARLSGVPYA